MRIDVAATPDGLDPAAVAASTVLVIDVLRASTCIVTALANGCEAIVPVASPEEARRRAAELDRSLIAGERRGEPLQGFDLGNSPLEFLEPRAEAVVHTTTNGTRAIVQAAANCDVVLVGSMLNLQAVASAARGRGEDVEVVCAGLRGGPSEDDAYCAGRIAALLGGEPTEAARRALELAASFTDAEGAFRTIRRVGETVSEEDLVWCARESVAEVVPRFDGMRGAAARLVP